MDQRDILSLSSFFKSPPAFQSRSPRAEPDVFSAGNHHESPVSPG